MENRWHCQDFIPFLSTFLSGFFTYGILFYCLDNISFTFALPVVLYGRCISVIIIRKKSSTLRTITCILIHIISYVIPPNTISLNYEQAMTYREYH